VRRIEATLRMRKAQKSYYRDRELCIFLQGIFRGKLIRRWIKKLHTSAVLIQSLFRGQLLRKVILALDQCARRIQRVYRSRIAWIECNKRHTAADVIMRCERQRCAGESLRQLRAEKHDEIVHEAYDDDNRVQHKIVEAVLLIQSWARGMNCRRKHAQMCDSCAKIQVRQSFL
jgi:hypothetical protein